MYPKRGGDQSRENAFSYGGVGVVVLNQPPTSSETTRCRQAAAAPSGGSSQLRQGGARWSGVIDGGEVTAASSSFKGREPELTFGGMGTVSIQMPQALPEAA